VTLPGDAAGERPRPQFGEYATPAEQAAHVRHPLPVPPVAWPESTEPDPVAKRQALTSGRILDRAVAVALLAYGLLSLINAAPATMDPRPLLDMLGLDSSELGLTTTGGWGIAALVVLIAGWALTAWLTWRAHRRGFRSVFWIPLVGGFVFNLVSGILVSVALLSDPGVLDALLRQQGS